MSSEPSQTKVLKGKYQITKNTFVTCYLHILEANESEIRTLLKLKSNAYTMVPVGTTIFFNVEALSKSGEDQEKSYTIFSVKVRRVEDLDGNSLHICTGINKVHRGELRAAGRRTLDFSVGLGESQAMFTAREGNNKGLTLQYTAKHAMVSLVLERTYEFAVQLKGEDYLLPGKIKHIQYDWQTYQHIIGVHFADLNKEQDMILNLLVDPDYVIPISNKASVDSAAGKISLD